MIRANLEQLFIYACRESAAVRAEAPRMNSNAFNHHAEMVERTKSFLYAHIHEKITLARVAAEISVSPSHLKRVFREQTGQSVIAYLTDLRVRRAKQMICDHQYNFSQIAEAVGFDSVYYFSARFKKYTGMTPGLRPLRAPLSALPWHFPARPDRARKKSIRESLEGGGCT